MLAFLFLHVERPRPITNYARVHTERKWNGWHEWVQRRLNGTEWNGSVTVFLTPIVYEKRERRERECERREREREREKKREREREERERRERAAREREQTHLITSSFDILSLSQRKPATPNRRYREGGLEVDVVRGRGLRVLLAHLMRIGNNLYTCRAPLLNQFYQSVPGLYPYYCFFFGGGGGGGAG